MFGFLKRRKAAKSMEAVGRAYIGTIGDNAAADVNNLFQVVGEADEETLRIFQSRLEGVGEAEGLSPKQEAEIELAAVMDQWREDRVALRRQGDEFLSGVFEIAKVIDATEDVRAMVEERWNQVDLDFQARVVIVFGDATEGLSDVPNPSFDPETATIGAILARMTKAEGRTMPRSELIQLYRRSVDIAWMDNHVSEGEQRVAEATAESLRTTLLASMADEPEAFSAFQEASDNHRDMIPFYGRNSLGWLVNERQVSSADLVDFIVRPEFAELLPTYLTMMEDETLADIRLPVLRSLVRARRDDAGQSDTRSLVGLLQRGDRSVEILLRTNELRVLRNADENYAAAETLTTTIMNESERG